MSSAKALSKPARMPGSGGPEATDCLEPSGTATPIPYLPAEG